MAVWRRWLFLGLLAAMAGCKDVTYKFPTESLAADTGAPKLDSVDPAHWDKMNAFALRATQAAAQENKGNLAFCPLGLWSISAVLLNASNGASYTAAESVIGIKDARLDDVNGAQRAWLASLGDKSPLKQGLGVWMIWPIMVTPAFRDDMARDYDADVVKIGSAGENATNVINAWANRRTGGAVPRVVDSLDKETIMLITHVVSIDAKWPEPLGLRGEQPFRMADGTTVQAAMVGAKVDCRWLNDPKWEGCVLPFQDGRFGLALMIPKGLTSVRKTLADTKTLPTIKSESFGVDFTVPKFKLDSGIDLRPVIADMGGSQWLAPPNNFRQMSIEFDSEAYLRRVLQRVTAELDENGFRATAVTVAEGAKSDVPQNEKKLLLDRPFLWALVDLQTGLYLIDGIVDDPTKN